MPGIKSFEVKRTPNHVCVVKVEIIDRQTLKLLSIKTVKGTAVRFNEGTRTFVKGEHSARYELSEYVKRLMRSAWSKETGIPYHV